MRTQHSRWTVLLSLALLCSAEGQNPAKPTRPPVAVKLVHASWQPAMETDLGITKAAFQEMGLENLTTPQLDQVVLWAANREKQAKDSIQATSFNCGRPSETFPAEKPEAYDHVRVYVTATGKVPEIISGVRERLRSMNGVEAVYTRNEADLEVSLVGLATESKAGYPTGVAIAIAVTKPCMLKIGTFTADYDDLRGNFIQVGSDTSVVVGSIVSSIDTDAIEAERKNNAGLKKWLESRK